jgi:hypothetical protein
MNEIQKANAKVAIEYYQKVLAGENPKVMFESLGNSGVCNFGRPEFSSDYIRYSWPQEMVEHKGGSYPKPVAVEDIVSVKQYYIADPLNNEFFDYLTGPRAGDVFKRQVNRGIIHETKEAAISHAKVMLGVCDE